MRIGIIISVLIIVIFGTVALLMMKGSVDKPTAATSPQRLVKSVLPDALPALWEVIEPEADASGLYLKAIRLYDVNRRRYQLENPPSDLVLDLCSVMSDARQAGKVTNGFLDGMIPMKPAPLPQFGDALESIPLVLQLRATELVEKQNDMPGATKLIEASLALGRRCFENNVRFYNRRVGLEIMDTALRNLERLAGNDQDRRAKLNQWADAVGKVQQAWEPKLDLIASVKPHIGDLLNLVRNDEDRTFRVAGTLYLGIAKFVPRSSGNKKAIEQTMKDLAASSDDMVAAAAKAAEAFTIEEYRRIW